LNGTLADITVIMVTSINILLFHVYYFNPNWTEIYTDRNL